MAGFLARAARFAASPRGRRLIAQAKTYAADPQRREQAKQTARRIRQRIADPNDDGETPPPRDGKDAPRG